MMRRVLLFAVVFFGCERNLPPPRAQQEVPIGLTPSSLESEPTPEGAEAPGSSTSDASLVAMSPQADGGVAAPPAVAVAAPALPGGGHAIDPIGFLAFARRVASIGNDAQLVSIVAERVSLLGTVDLTSSTAGTSIDYRFKRREPTARPAGPQPLPPLPIAGEDIGPSIAVTEVRVDALGVHAPTTRNEANVAPLPDPRCTTKKLMGAAKRAGAPTGATGSLVYGDTAGTHWALHFESAGIDLFIRDPSCTVDTTTPTPRMGM